MRMTRSSRCYEDVLLVNEIGLRGIGAEPRMVLLENAHVPPRKQLLPADPRYQQRKLADREIDFACLQRGMKVLQAHLGSSHPYAGSIAQQQPDDGKEQHDNTGVERENTEGPIRCIRVEMELLVAQTLHSVEQRADRLLEFKRLGRRLHVQCHTDKQWIVEIAPQARQRLAQRRLTGVQRFSGAGQASVAKQRVQYAERVEIEVFGLLVRNNLQIAPAIA